MARPSFFDWLFVELKHLLQGISLTLKQLEGIGIGFPGVIGDTEGRLSQAPALPWPVADIRPVIRRYYEGRLYLDNDVNLALLGECWKVPLREKTCADGDGRYRHRKCDAVEWPAL